MKIDLNYLNRFSKLNVDEEVSFDEKYLEGCEIRRISNVRVSGLISIDYEDNLIVELKMTGKMILPCALSLKDVDYEFDTEFEENLGKFEEIYKNNKNILEISDILWENIVLEIPIRVVSDEIEPSNTSGDGWELISE